MLSTNEISKTSGGLSSKLIKLDIYVLYLNNEYIGTIIDIREFLKIYI